MPVPEIQLRGVHENGDRSVAGDAGGDLITGQEGQLRVPIGVRSRDRAWIGWVMAFGMASLLVALYWPVLVPLIRQWYGDSNYSHGFLIPIMSAYFAWQRRAELGRVVPEPSWWGLFPTLGGLLLLAIGQVGAELFLQRVSLVVVIAGLVFLVLGARVLRLLSFPLAFLLFMIPIPALVLNAVALPLQSFAAQAATSCLVALEIPVLREGHIIVLPHTSLEVAEACSGIRSLMSLLALSTAYAYFTQHVLWKRWVIVAAAIPVAIVANAFRVAGTGVLAHYIGDEAAQGFYHDFSGWLVFVVAFLLLLMIGGIVSRIGARARV